jgi:hypothetical protein
MDSPFRSVVRHSVSRCCSGAPLDDSKKPPFARNIRARAGRLSPCEESAPCHSDARTGRFHITFPNPPAGVSGRAGAREILQKCFDVFVHSDRLIPDQVYALEATIDGVVPLCADGIRCAKPIPDQQDEDRHHSEHERDGEAFHGVVLSSVARNTIPNSPCILAAHSNGYWTAGVVPHSRHRSGAGVDRPPPCE